MPEHDDESRPESPPRQPEVSRTQRKREAEALFGLGQRLVELAPSELDRIPLDDRLRREIETGRRLTQRGARKRQLKLIGALLREAEHEAIQAAFEGLTAPAPAARAEQKAIERWRRRLLEEGEAGDDALTRFVDEHPGVDVQQLRRLQRAARLPSSEEKGKRAAKELFQLIAAEVRSD